MPRHNPFERLLCARCNRDFNQDDDDDPDQGRYMSTGAGFCDDCDDWLQTGTSTCAACRSFIPYNEIYLGYAGQEHHMSDFWCSLCWHRAEDSQDEGSEEEEDEPPARTLGNGVTFRIPAEEQQDAAARNQRDLGRLRAAFPGHCCHNLLYGYVLQRGRACTNHQVQGQTQADADDVGWAASRVAGSGATRSQTSWRTSCSSPGPTKQV